MKTALDRVSRSAIDGLWVTSRSARPPFRFPLPRRGAIAFWLALPALLSGCGESSRIPSVAPPAAVVPAPTSSPSGPAAPKIKVLSNRADLISGGDALIEVTPATGTSGGTAKVELNGVDVTSQFANTADGRQMALLSGLLPGRNVVVAREGSNSNAYVVTNHPNAGPIFSGPQLKPWVCQDGAADGDCNQPPTFSYVYLSTGKDKQGFQPYDPKNPASDVAVTTTEDGLKLPFIVRIEKGYQNRDQYSIAALYQPDKPWTALAPQAQFNHKLLITHGVGCGVDHKTGSAPSVTKYQPANLLALTGASTMSLPTEVTADSVQYALGAGFVVMSTALDNSSHNCNVAVQAESLVMAKERVIERYGPLRFTIGTGCSGGSLAQQWVANAYPGIYQGILPTCSFADAWSTATQFADYHLMLAYFQDPSRWAQGVVWSPTQMADAEGHLAIVNSVVSDNAQFHVSVPTDPCAGVSATERYHPDTNPGGVRCDIQDAAINLFGPRPRELWSTQEKAVGRGFAGFPVDNVGVMYGLGALRSARITPSQFVDLNVKVGGLDLDTNPIKERTPAIEPALTNAYRTGLINVTNNLDQTAIIDCRGPDQGLFHDSYRTFAIRARLDREHGTHANQLVWEGPFTIIGDANCNLNSLVAMNRWLVAVEKDTRNVPIAKKLLANKPADLSDACFNGTGTKLTNDLCGDAVVPVYGTPRTVAGDGVNTDSNKCQLKPLKRTDDFGLVPFTDAEWAALQKVFPDGVCDFTKPAVSRQGTIPWQTYQTAVGDVIYGGTAMPSAPADSGSGWASPAFQPFGLR